MPREMKDSGIEWIGEIPVEWSIVRIGSQYSERKTKVSDTEYPPLSVTMKGILPQLSTAAKTDAHDDRKLVCKGDFAINSRSDRRGSCGISPYDGSVSLINTILCPRDEMNPQYYDWLFHSTMFSDEFYKWGHGIVDDLWTTNWQDMKKISIPAPPLPEQQKIASFLDSECAKIDDVITKTKATIEEYKKLKQSVITEAVTKGIRPNREMKDSGIEWIGEIPENWSTVPIKRVLVEINNRTENGSGEPLSVNQKKGVVKSSESDAANPSQTTEGWKKVSINDIVFNKYKAHSGVFFVSKYEGIVTFNYSVFRCIETNQPQYFEYLFKTTGCIGEFRKQMRGVGDSISPLYSRDLFKIMISVPPVTEQIEIIEFLNTKRSEIDTLIAKKEQIVTELESYKKSLIYEYVTGKKEV